MLAIWSTFSKASSSGVDVERAYACSHFRAMSGSERKDDSMDVQNAAAMPSDAAVESAVPNHRALAPLYARQRDAAVLESGDV